MLRECLEENLRVVWIIGDEINTTAKEERRERW